MFTMKMPVANKDVYSQDAYGQTDTREVAQASAQPGAGENSGIGQGSRPSQKGRLSLGTIRLHFGQI